jgi:alpha-galactosidase
MRACLDECGRDIVYSLCQYGMGNVSEWGESVGGNYWRTTGDIHDSWSSMSGIGFGQNGLEQYAGPGHWNDPDMLVVGKVGWGPELRDSLEQYAGPGHWNDPDMLVVGKVGWRPELRDSRLSPNEQVTHITLWSLLAAPMLIGCDLSQLDEFTVALLTNPEVIEVNQDPLGRQGHRVAVDGKTEVWARPLSDGTKAVGLFNRGRREADVTVLWSDIELSGPRPVRNLWTRKDLGSFEGSYATVVPKHGAVMLKIGTPSEEDTPVD